MSTVKLERAKLGATYTHHPSPCQSNGDPLDPGFSRNSPHSFAMGSSLGVRLHNLWLVEHKLLHNKSPPCKGFNKKPNDAPTLLLLTATGIGTIV